MARRAAGRKAAQGPLGKLRPPRRDAQRGQEPARRPPPPEPGSGTGILPVRWRRQTRAGLTPNGRLTGQAGRLSHYGVGAAVRGFKARTSGWENSHPARRHPLPHRGRGQGEGAVQGKRARNSGFRSPPERCRWAGSARGSRDVVGGALTTSFHGLGPHRCVRERVVRRGPPAVRATACNGKGAPQASPRLRRMADVAAALFKV